MYKMVILTTLIIVSGLVAAVIVINKTAAELIKAKEEGKVVVSTTPLGSLVSTTFHNGGFNTSAKTTITTTEGVFIVLGAMSTYINDDVSLKERANGRKYICTTKMDYCNRLVVY